MNPSSASPPPAPTLAPQPPAINFAAEWLDEDGRVYPKNVDYATQCPKGHALAPCAGGGGGGAAVLICRVCHGFRQREHALQWLVCSVAGCCEGYAVCDACVIALGSAPAAGAGGDDFSMIVSRRAWQQKPHLLCL